MNAAARAVCSAQLRRQTRQPPLNRTTVWNTLTCQGRTLKKCFTLRYPSVHSPLRAKVVYNTTQVTG